MSECKFKAYNIWNSKGYYDTESTKKNLQGYYKVIKRSTKINCERIQGGYSKAYTNMDFERTLEWILLD